MKTAYDLSEISIFIVEENSFLRQLLMDLLKEFKPKRVYTESRFDIALERVSEIMPDIIFAGWTPYSEIIHFFKGLRRSPNMELAVLPIITFSSYSEKNYVMAARDLGMNEYLALPLSAQSVYSRICKIIEYPRIFVESERYCGPDRRVKNIPCEGEDRRQQTEELNN